MLAEAVGQFNYANGKTFDCRYRRAGNVEEQIQQALRHAQAHNKAAANRRNCGVLAWVAFDYPSLANSYRGVKCPGVSDIFRIPKLGASFYLSQCDQKYRPVIQINFYWEFGFGSGEGPGKNASIFSNCERLELFIDGRQHAVLHPDSKNYPNLKHPPFFVDIERGSKPNPELRIDGYVGEVLVITHSYSSDQEKDQFILEADDKELMADGSDATRCVFKVADKFGSIRPFAKGEVIFKVEGPGSIAGDNPFRLEESGGAGAIWIKTIQGKTGNIGLTAIHPLLGVKSVTVKAVTNVKA